MSVWSLWIVHIVAQQCHTKLFVGTVHKSNQLVSFIALLIYVFQQFWVQHWGQLLISSNVFCYNDQLLPQTHEHFQIWLSHCKILDQVKVCCYLSWTIWVFYPTTWNHFGPKKSIKSAMAFSKVHVVCTEEFVQGSNSFINQSVWSVR